MKYWASAKTPIKPLSEPMVVILLTHKCVTRPQWIKSTQVSLNKCMLQRIYKPKSVFTISYSFKEGIVPCCSDCKPSWLNLPITLNCITWHFCKFVKSFKTPTFSSFYIYRDGIHCIRTRPMRVDISICCTHYYLHDEPNTHGFVTVASVYLYLVNSL